MVATGVANMVHITTIFLLTTHRVLRALYVPPLKLNEVMDMRNNVMFNYSGESCYGGEGMNVNIVNNYYKPDLEISMSMAATIRDSHCRNRNPHCGLCA